MNKTSIEWCDFSWNPVTGCLGPGGAPGNPKRCPYCYAHRLANGRLHKLYMSNTLVAAACDPADPFSPRFWPKRLEEPLGRRKPAKIFPVDMGDLFHPYIPIDWQMQVLEVASGSPRQTFQYLTKYPAGYANPAFGTWGKGWLRNEWLGITVINQRDWDERWPILAQVDCAVKFVSFEPLLGPVDMGGERPDWIILGSQTKPDRIPDYEWVGELLWQARQAGIPTFVKNSLSEERTRYYIPRPREWPE